MKHCIGIIAHKAVPQLKWLVSTLLEQDAIVLVHADAKTRSVILELLEENSSLVIPESINVQRAHFSLIEASIQLMKRSLTQDYDYFHLISGDDIPVKPLNTLSEFLSKGNYNYINYNSFPLTKAEVKNSDHFPNTNIRRDQIPISNYMHFSMKYGPGLYESFQFPANHLAKRIIAKLGKYRTFWRLYHSILKRKVPQKQFFIGSAWFSVQKQIIKHFVESSEQDKHFYRFFKHVAYPDEIYFHTLALNSPWKNTVINSDLRYINWDLLENGGPSTLKATHINEIISSNGYFARKWNIETEEEFKEIISKLHVK